MGVILFKPSQRTNESSPTPSLIVSITVISTPFSMLHHIHPSILSDHGYTSFSIFAVPEPSHGGVGKLVALGDSPLSFISCFNYLHYSKQWCFIFLMATQQFFMQTYHCVLICCLPYRHLDCFSFFIVYCDQSYWELMCASFLVEVISISQGTNRVCASLLT